LACSDHPSPRSNGPTERCETAWPSACSPSTRRRWLFEHHRSGRALGVATLTVVGERLEILKQLRVGVAQPRPTTAGTAHTAGPEHLPSGKIGLPATDPRRRDRRRARDRLNPAIAQRPRLRGRPQPRHPLIKMRPDQLELRSHDILAEHPPSFAAAPRPPSHEIEQLFLLKP
jgi:hypothetical protein